MPLQEADFSQTANAFAGNQGRYMGDETLLVRFFLHPRISPAKSAEEQRPIYEELPYVQIMQPGNKDNIVIRPAMQMDKDRFPEHWRKYLARESQEAVEGTLLDQWPGITRGQCEELKYFNCRTVEQLVAMTDVHAQRIMGYQMLKQKAIKFLETAGSDKLAAELEERDARIEDLMARLDALENPEED